MEKGYKRLTPEQPVGLRHAGYVISVEKVIKVRPGVNVPLSLLFPVFIHLKFSLFKNCIFEFYNNFDSTIFGTGCSG